MTFTDKAAGELKARLAALGVSGVRARDLPLRGASRSCATSRRSAVGRILPSKALALRQIANTLPAPYKFRPAGDLATEIEWAKNRRISPGALRAPGHEPPIPLDLMQRVYREYERRKEAEGLVDFEDLLELAVRLFEDDQGARETFRAQYRAFTVDEYQDVNLLQQTLLELWLGDRDDLCVVGDDYQSIYGFTGATPSYLLAVPHRFPQALVVRLEENYRSTPQVLALANTARAEPRRRREDAARDPPRRRPSPPCGRSPRPEDEWRRDRRRDPRARRRAALEEIAILARTNARLTDFEEAAARRRHPVPGRRRCSSATPRAC